MLTTPLALHKPHLVGGQFNLITSNSDTTMTSHSKLQMSDLHLNKINQFLIKVLTNTVCKRGVVIDNQHTVAR